MGVAVSVLVPVYNVEKTLDRCLQSILNQTFKDFEIILIDDGSTDNSGALCDKYVQEHNNIRVIHKENEGLGPTRNAGINAAVGDYIYHCDSDDWLKEDLLEKAYNTAVKTDAQVVIFGYDIFTEKDGNLVPFESIYAESGEYVGKESVREFFVKQYFNSYFALSACTRIYKRSFLIENNVFFPSFRRAQDMAYSLLLFENTEKLVVLKDTFYCYVVNPGTYKGRSFDEMIDIYCSVFEMTAKYFDSWGHFAGDTKQKLINNVCERIANYSAYAFVVKYIEQKDNIKTLLNNNMVKSYFKSYKNSKKSKFMFLFCLAMRLKSVNFMLTVCKLARIGVEK